MYHLMKSIIIPAIFVMCFQVGVISSARGDTKADAIFADLEAKYGVADAKGSLPNVGVHYIIFCRKTIGLVLFRLEDQGPQIYKREDFCGSEVDEIDYDGDGQFEIRYTTVGTGSGFVGVREHIYNWPAKINAPVKGFSYVRLEASSPGHRFFYDKKGREEIAFFDTIIKRQMLVGENCDKAKYCPVWPEGQPCRQAMKCDIAEDKKLVFHGSLPKELIGNPKWEAYLEEQIKDGFTIEGVDIPKKLEELNFSDLADHDQGGRAPKMTKEQSKALDKWLN